MKKYDDYESPRLIDHSDMNSQDNPLDPQPQSAFILPVGVTVAVADFVVAVNIGWDVNIGPDQA